MNRRIAVALFASVLLVACGERADRQHEAGETGAAPVADGPRPEPIVVYATHDDAAYLPGLFAGFTRDTGIRVTVRHGEAGRLVDDLIAKRGSPPADILVTPSVAGIWRAADEGALLPLNAAAAMANVPAPLRDPDGYWSAWSYRKAQLVYDSRAFAAGEVTAYADLANPEFEGKLCLGSSALAVNRGVIAMLIRTLGRRPAEIVVRGWVANLALPPLRSEDALLAAIESGTCKVGLLSSDTIQSSLMPGNNSALAVVTPDEVFMNAEAIGLNRHAREPDNARRLISWMLGTGVQDRHSAATATLPVAAATDLPATGIAAVGAFDEDARLLAERARYP